MTMNKIFKVVFNAARGKLMVVNEKTVSTSYAKKSMVVVAVTAALASTTAVAASLTDVDGTFKVVSDDATLIYGDRTIHSNSLYFAGFQFASLPANGSDTNIDIQNTYNYLSIGAITPQDAARGENVTIDILGDLTLQPGSQITNFKEGDVFRAKNITLGLLSNTQPTQAGGVIEASDTLTFTNNFKLYSGTVSAQTMDGLYSVRFDGDSVVTVPTIRIVNSMDLYGQTLVTTEDFAIGGTLTQAEESQFVGGIPKVTFLAKDDVANAPRIQLMGTQPIVIGELIVEKTPGVGTTVNEAMLTDKMTTTDSGVTSFTINKLTLNEGSILSVYADSKEANAPQTAIQIGTAELANQSKLNLGFRSSDFENAFGEKQIQSLILGEDAVLMAKSGTNPDGVTPLTDNADITIQTIALNGANATVSANLIGDATKVTLSDGATGTSIASVSTKALTVNVENPTTSDLTVGAVNGTTQVAITTSNDFNTGDAKANLQQLADAVTMTNTNEATVNVAIGETDVYGALRGQVDANGQLIGVREAVNTKTASIGESLTVMPTIMTRILTNDLRLRLGEVRDAEGQSGTWIRYNGGNLHGLGLDTDFNMVQVGIDTMPTEHHFRFGVAFGYANSDTKATVKNEADQYSLAAYGLWQGEYGEFVDIVARMASIKSDLTATSGQKADLNHLALSLSGEFGWRWDVTDMFYVEPTMEAIYTHVDSDKFSLGSVQYEMKSVDSLVGRIGLASGLQCPNNMGEVYLRVGVAHEFMGDSTLGVNGGVRSYEKNGEDTWIEYAIGMNVNLSKSTYIYADLERTAGGDIDEDWRANVGLRYAF